MIARIKSTATILAGQSVSDAIHLHHGILASITMPAAWTAASLLIEVSTNGGTSYYTAYAEAGTTLEIVTAASRSVVFQQPAKLMSLGLIRLRSVTPGTTTPVVQAADRVITVISMTS